MAVSDRVKFLGALGEYTEEPYVFMISPRPKKWTVQSLKSTMGCTQHYHPFEHTGELPVEAVVRQLSRGVENAVEGALISICSLAITKVSNNNI